MHRMIAVTLLLFAAIPGRAQNAPSAFELLHAKAAHECLNNSVAYVGEGVPYTTCWGTSDIGGQINAAVAAVQQYKNKTGKVVIQTGTYTFTTPIAMPYWVMLDGQFAILISNVTSGCSIVDGATIPDSPHFGWTYNNGGMKDVGLFNGSKAPYGICLGGDSSGTLTPSKNRTILSTFINVHVHGFSQANYVLGNSASQNSWVGGAITNAAGDGIRLINSIPIENDSFFNTQILNNKGYGVDATNANSSDFYFYGVSMDYNAAGAINWNFGSLVICGGHYEQAANYIINGGPSGDVTRITVDCGPTFALTRTSGTDPAFIYVGGTNARVSIGPGLTAYMGPGHTVNELINWQAAGGGNVLEVASYRPYKGSLGAQLPAVQPAPNIQFSNLPEYSAGLQTDHYIQALKTSTVLSEELASPPPGASGQDICYGDRTTHSLKCSYNNRPFLPLPQIVAAGTTTLGNNSIGATSCAAVVSTAAPGTFATDSVEWAYASAPSGSTDGKLILNHYVTSGTVNWMLCNPTAATQAPTGLVVNWRVIR